MFEASTCTLSQEAVRSPGLRSAKELGPAYELKFHLSLAEAATLEGWARRHLTADPHGVDGTYRVTSVYCDTPHFDVFHRTAGYRRSKYRLRRYGVGDAIYLERKTRRGDQVRKRRTEILPVELDQLASLANPLNWAGGWFQRRVHFLSLQPTCRVGYWRTAFFGLAAGQPVRLTIDRELVGVPMTRWDVPPLQEGVPLLAGEALMELKFHTHLPVLFQTLLPQLPCRQARVSKYRRCVEQSGMEIETRNPEIQNS